MINHCFEHENSFLIYYNSQHYSIIIFFTNTYTILMAKDLSNYTTVPVDSTGI